MDDASLEDFLDADDPDDEDRGSESTTAESEAVADETRTDPASVEPARPTHHWTPDGAACDACGQVVQRRWTGDEGLVCVDCKEW